VWTAVQGSESFWGEECCGEDGFVIAVRFSFFSFFSFFLCVSMTLTLLVSLPVSQRGCGVDLLVNVLLTVLGYIPGVLHGGCRLCVVWTGSFKLMVAFLTRLRMHLVSSTRAAVYIIGKY
jgi:uncharacterized membrane protein YqaE (UPF0057 family)